MEKMTTCPICKREFDRNQGGLTDFINKDGNISWICRECAIKIIKQEIKTE